MARVVKRRNLKSLSHKIHVIMASLLKLAQIYGETYLGNIIGSIAPVDLPTCWLQIMVTEYIVK